MSCGIKRSQACDTKDLQLVTANTLNALLRMLMEKSNMTLYT